MDAPPSRTRRFRPRDEASNLQELIVANQINTNDEELQLGEGGSRGGGYEEQAITDSFSVSSDCEEETEMESMTAKGVQNLCSELLELKNESDEDFKMSIFSNYSVFLRIFEHMEGLKSELMELKLQASTQKRVIEDLTKTVSLTVLSEEIMESVFEESLKERKLSPSMLEVHTDDVLEILDLLISEHRLDEALSVLEMEDRALQSLRIGESFSQEELLAYNSAIAEKRTVLEDQLTHLAENPRISAPELQHALVGLCKLGNSHLALQLLLDYYQGCIARSMRDLHSTIAVQHGLAIREVAKHVFSMISQAARSFVGLHAENSSSSYAPELIQWSQDETGLFAAFLIKYVESTSEISGGLSTVVEAVQYALSYCALLENQKLFLRPCLINQISPCIEKILLIQVDHYKKVISIFTATDTWIIGRYLGSGVMSKGTLHSYVDEKPEYCLLTSSGRKFLTLFQDIVDDCSPLVSLQMEVFLLREVMELFTEYITILEAALAAADGENGSRIHPAETLIQGISVLANLFTLMELFSNITKRVFGNIENLKFEIDNYVLFIQETHARLRSHFFQKVTQKLFSSEASKTHAAESCIALQNDSDGRPLVPSTPCQAFYLELRKLQKFAEDSYIEVEWLEGLLKELMETIFAWISNKDGILAAINDPLEEENYTSLMQFILDLHFLEEIASNGGYLSGDTFDASRNIAAQVESCLERYDVDRKWASDAAIQAIQKLEELDQEESSTIEIANGLEDETNECESTCSSDLFEDEDNEEISSKHSFESPKGSPASEPRDNHGERDSSEYLSHGDCLEPLEERPDETQSTSHSLLEMLLTENNVEEAPVATERNWRG